MSVVNWRTISYGFPANAAIRLFQANVFLLANRVVNALMAQTQVL